MPTRVSAVILFVTVACFAEDAPLSEADLKNLLAGIRANRSTQADFQEERAIRLMKKPIVSSGRISFQPPNKFRREVKGNSPSITVSDRRPVDLLSQLQIGGALPVRKRIAAGFNRGGD